MCVGGNYGGAGSATVFCDFRAASLPSLCNKYTQECLRSNQLIKSVINLYPTIYIKFLSNNIMAKTWRGCQRIGKSRMQESGSTRSSLLFMSRIFGLKRISFSSLRPTPLAPTVHHIFSYRKMLFIFILFDVAKYWRLLPTQSGETMSI